MNFESALEQLRRGRHLVANVVAEQAHAHAWVGVYPLDPSRSSTAPVLRRLGATEIPAGSPVYRVRVIEVSNTNLEQDRWLSEQDLLSREDVIVAGEEALFARLEQLGVAQALELPDASDYPI